MIAFLLACSGPDNDRPSDDVPSTGDSASFDVEASVAIPAAGAPLVRSLHVEASVPVRIDARWAAADHEVTAAFDTSAAVQDHLLLGWRAGRDYRLEVTATADDGRAVTVPIDVETAPLPSHFPAATVRRLSERSPGHTLMPLRSTQAPDPREVVLVFDEEGEICFWLELGDILLDVSELPAEAGGGLQVLVGDLPGTILEFGWDGVQRARYALAPAPGAVEVLATDARSFHHDVIRVEPDRLVALARYPIQVPDYPASYDDPLPTQPRTVAEDVILDFRTDGTVLHELRMSEILPVHRIGYGSLGATVEGWADWAHTNAVVWDAGSYVVSARHQDAVLKVGPDGAVAWILGHPDNWPPELAALRLEPVGDLRWPYHPHAPRFGPDGPNGERTLLLFDNGNFQAAPWTGEPPVTDRALLSSRVVRFMIDEEARTVRQDWAFDAPAGGRLYSEAVGDANVLPDGHVLSTWGMLEELPDGTTNEDAGLGEHTVRVIELDGPTEVEELYLWSRAEDNARGWTAYRARRIPSLYGRVD